MGVYLFLREQTLARPFFIAGKGRNTGKIPVFRPFFEKPVADAAQIAYNAADGFGNDSKTAFHDGKDGEA